jgi:signal transduction histidine kinase
LGLVDALHWITQSELKGAFDQVSWQISSDARRESAELPPLTAEVLFYAAREAMRNAARHARHPQSDEALHLRVVIEWREGLDICIEDNGVGIEEPLESQGAGGQGLALHSTMLAIIGGALSVESVPGASTLVRIKLPQQELRNSRSHLGYRDDHSTAC